MTREKCLKKNNNSLTYAMIDEGIDTEAPIVASVADTHEASTPRN
jgi:Mg2+ and Co2+ transporter CorA